MKRLRALVIVLVLLALMVSMVSFAAADGGNIKGDITINPNSLPTDQISLNNIVFQPPRPTGVASDDVTTNDKTTIVGDIDIDPDSLPTDQLSLNHIVTDHPEEDAVQKVREAAS